MVCNALHELLINFRGDGLHFVAEQNSYVAVRLNPDGIVLQTPAGDPFNLLQKLKPLQRSGQIAA